jgi:DNA repair exonuclease SbcCD nuclease subunit
LRFLHTADWQIGMKAAHTGAAASRVREVRFSAARRVVELANQHQVDALLIAGDTFEHSAVSREDVERVADVMARCTRPTYLIPGNHDPDVAGGIWRQRLWESLPQLTICRETKPIWLSGGQTGSEATLFPCPMNSKYSSEDPTAWIAASPSQGIRVGLAHGSLLLMPELAGESSPIPIGAAQRAGLDYLALGHWHSVFVAEGNRVAYSGTHEATKFGEPRSGNALLVEIGAPGATPQITALPTGVLQWREEKRSLSGLEDLARLRRDLESWPASRETLLQVMLDGALPPEGFAQIEELSQFGAANFCYFSLRSSKVRPEGEAHLPPGLFAGVEARLKQKAGGNLKTAEAQFALRELYRLAGQVRHEAGE